MDLNARPAPPPRCAGGWVLPIGSTTSYSQTALPAAVASIDRMRSRTGPARAADLPDGDKDLGSLRAGMALDLPETCVAQGGQPLGTGEQAEDVAIMFDAHVHTVAQEVGEVDDVCRVGGERVPCPLEVAKPSRSFVVAAVFCARREGFPQAGWTQECHATGMQVHVGCGHRSPEIIEVDQVVDGVVDASSAYSLGAVSR